MKPIPIGMIWICYACLTMIEPKYIITAYNKLLGCREALTKPHDITWCLNVLHSTKNERSRKKTCHKLYKIERVKPTQLNINFND